jgi:hypothetical protein
MGNLQSANVADRLADVPLQYSGDLPAKCRVVKHERTDVVFSVIFYHQVASVRRAGAIPVNIPEYAAFTPDGLVVSPSSLRPYRRPIGEAMAPHKWMISELHSFAPYS